MINSYHYDTRDVFYTANKDNMNETKSFDLHNIKHTNSSLYKSLELILGTTVGNDKYVHDYNQYGIRNIPLTGDTLKYIGDKLKAGFYNLDRDRVYSFLNVLDEQTQQTEHTYVYEVLASKTKEFNKVRIPVYIDEGNTTTGIVKDDYIKAILNLDIEINYLERKEVRYPADLRYDANLLYNTGTKDYDQISQFVAQSDKQYFREPYVYKGYSDRKGMGDDGLNSQSLTPMSYMTNMYRTGKYSKFTRHRNSRGNHSYRTKVEFFNTADGTLKEVSKLLAIEKEFMKPGTEITDIVDYDSRDRINLVTHQDMVWGVTKSMIGSNSNNRGYDNALQFMYVMTYLQNFPTVYIGFEEEDSQDVYLDNEKTIIDDKGLKRVGFITVTFLNFKELGLHPSQYNTKDMYARTCCDYSDNSRFNIRIAVPKGVPNLIYKGQSIKGSEIILMPGYVEYDNNKFITTELGLGPEKPFRVLDDVKHMVIHCGFQNNTALLNRIDGSKVDDKDNALKLFRMAIRNRISNIPYNKNWLNAYDNGFTFDREVVCNFGGWVFPPMRLSAIGYATSHTYDNLGLSTVSYIEYDRPYRIGYTEQYTRQYHGPMAEPLTNLYRRAKEKNGIWFNMQLNYMCAREYVGLQPIFKRILHGQIVNTKSGARYE